MIIQIDDYNLDLQHVMYIKEDLKSFKKEDIEFFKEWHGSTNINKVFEDVIRKHIQDGTDETQDFRIEAKITGGELEQYPFINRTTKDGWVAVESDFTLDDYHSMFLKIGSEFRMIPNDISMKDLMLKRRVIDCI